MRTLETGAREKCHAETQWSSPGKQKALVRAPVLRQLAFVLSYGNREARLSQHFLFVALCASLFVNFVLMVAAFQRFGGSREIEPTPAFP